MRLGRLVLYVRDVEATIRFYETHFGYSAKRRQDDRIVELIAPAGGTHLLIHPAGRAQKMGQALVKLVFDIADVGAFRTECRINGLDFGPIHQADGYQFANAKDPSGNSISISSRAFRCA